MQSDPELMMDEEMELDPDLNHTTNAILAASFDVHSELGAGYQEEVYANALASTSSD